MGIRLMLAALFEQDLKLGNDLQILRTPCRSLDPDQMFESSGCGFSQFIGRGPDTYLV